MHEEGRGPVCHRSLRRYWIRFEAGGGVEPVLGALGAAGVTAESEAAAFELLRQRLFRGAPLPPVQSVLPDVDVSTLDPVHVLPHAGPPALRGVWFPRTA